MTKNDIAALCLAFAAAAVQLAAPAHADDYLSPTDERVRLSLGVERVSNATNMRFDSTAGLPGTPISGENDLGLDSSDFLPKFQATVRVGERHRLRFDYFSLDRTGHATIENNPIVFRNSVLQVGDPVETTVSVRSLGIAYEYSFIHREKFELAATFGINETDLSARARVTTATQHINEPEDQAGPLPTLGLDSTYVISKRFYVDGRAQYLKVAVDHLTGTVGFYEFAALYRFRPNISFALGYTGVRADIESRQTKTSGYYDLSSKGPEAFVRVAF
jgi:hypothetical protein